MSNLQHRTTIIKEKRKKTPWRDFLLEICSWVSLMFYKNDGLVSKYPEVGRLSHIIDNDEYIKKYAVIVEKSSMDYDAISFFDQFMTMYSNYSFPATYQFFGCENSRFGDVIHDSKNAYLSFFVTTGSENVMYSLSVKQNSSNIVNSFFVSKHSENIYSSLLVTQSFDVFYSHNINNCSFIWFSKNLVGCVECIGCYNLINKSYCIDNVEYDKEEYFCLKKGILSQKYTFQQRYANLFNIKGENYLSLQCEGDYIIESNDVKNGLFVVNVKGGNNAILQASDVGAKNLYDSILGGSGDTFDLYGSIGAGLCNNLFCCIQCGTCVQMYYSLFCESCNFCLGCIGLKNKSYCILNKQYTKEERYDKVDEIFALMEKDGTLGEFFPPSMNPFYFNDTAAYLIDPTFTKEEVTAKGYLRRDEPIKVDIPVDAQVVNSSDLDQFESFDNDNRIIDPEVLKFVIQDEQGNYYRIIPMEYKFLMKYGLPLPRKHWLERMKENFRL